MLKDMMESSRPMAIREEMSFIRSEITCLTNDLEKITKLKNNITIQLLPEINGDSMKKKITETSEMALQKQEIIVKIEKQVVMKLAKNSSFKTDIGSMGHMQH